MAMISGPQMVCPGCEKAIDVPGICEDCREAFGIGDEEKCIGLSVCGGPCDETCPAHRASNPVPAGRKEG
ncbi:MAG TPA: hypothetical protein DHV36_17345 [Desulfobacteraceae bacterium]|nr:hypothetical protein [Desulfobacteraceae bacterium]